MNPRSARGNNSFFKFDKFKLETFEGDIRKYPQFKYDFINFIESEWRGNANGLAFVLKNHLGSSVQDEVANAMGATGRCGLDWKRSMGKLLV